MSIEEQVNSNNNDIAQAIESTGVLWSDSVQLITALSEANAEKWFIYTVVILQILLKFAVIALLFFALRWLLKPSKLKEMDAQNKLLELNKVKKGGRDA